MNCFCGAAAVYRVIVVKPADLPDQPAKVNGERWVVGFCVQHIPFTLRPSVVQRLRDLFVGRVKA